MAAGFVASRLLKATAKLVRANLQQCATAYAEAAVEIAAARAWLDGCPRDPDRDIIDHLEAARAIVGADDLRMESKAAALLDSCLHQLRFEQRRLEHLDRSTRS